MIFGTLSRDGWGRSWSNTIPACHLDLFTEQGVNDAMDARKPRTRCATDSRMPSNYNRKVVSINLQAAYLFAVGF